MSNKKQPNKVTNWLKIPDRVNACNKAKSWFLRFYDYATWDMGSEGQRCHCCIFWRGYFIALTMAVVPLLLCLLSLPRVAAIWFVLEVAILWGAMKISEFGEKFKD